MAPYPLTVSGLLSQLEAEADALTGYAGDLGGIRARRNATRTLVTELSAIIGALPGLRAILRAAVAPAPTQLPLYAPAGVDRAALVDVGTGAPAPIDASPVPWWPRVPSAAADVGATQLDDVSPPAVELTGAWLVFPQGRGYRGTRTPDYPVWAVAQSAGPVGDLVGWALAMAQVGGRDLGYHTAAQTMRGGTGRTRGDTRRGVRRAAARYRAASAWLAPFGDALTARLGAYVHSLTAALSALLAEENITMPTLTGTSSVVANLAERIRAAITTGHGGRLVVNESETAFAWAPGLPTSLLTYLAPEWVEGRKTTVTTARASATPVPPGGVAEGGAKPDAVAFDSAEVALVKYPGQATITTESAQFVRGIEPAIANVIGAQIIRAVEADAVDAMQAGAGIDVTGAADITAGVLSAIAQLRAGGANPNAVALSVNDWVTVMSATGQAGYLNFSNPEQGPVGTWLGLAPCIVSSLTDGNAVVVDGRSAPIGEPQGQPLCIVDPFTQAKNNKIVITIEAWAQTAVTSPGGVATVAVTVTP